MIRPRPFLCAAVALLIAGALPAACARGESDGDGWAGQEPVPGGFSGRARAAFDSASAAFEAGDPVRARDLFAAVLEEDSTLAAAWIGLHLAGRAMSDSVAADSTLRKARELIEPPRLPRGRGAKPIT
jgi:hypothetical protein